jgi:PAS domain S-box-containing protein
MAAPFDKTTLFSEIAKGVTDAAFVMDLERKILSFNRPLTRLHQMDRRQIKDIEGGFCRDFVSMEICDKSCILRKCVEAGDSVRFDEVRGRTKDGQELTLIVTAIPVRNPEGQIVAVLEMQRDVSDEAKIHEKYKVLLEKEQRAKEELERLVEARTAQLRRTNEELKRAEAQLVQSEKMSSLGQMVAGIAHELNNPINFISGNIDVMEEYIADLKKGMAEIECLGEKDGELKKVLEKLENELELEYKLNDLNSITTSVRKGSERATEIIVGLRTFSRLDEAQFKETDIHQDIDTTLMLLRNQFKDRIRIHKEYGEVPPFNCYASQLNQVYMNLLQNAIHAIPNEGDVWVRTRFADGNLTIEIQDSGSGIPKDVLGKIFDPFFTTKPVGKGTGLGLAVTYGIIERHAGKIEVESEIGKGTTFRVVIPDRKAPPEPKGETL